MGALTGTRVILLDVGDVLVETKPLISHATVEASMRCAEVFDFVSAESLTEAYIRADEEETRPHVNHLFGDLQIALSACKRIFGRENIGLAGSFLTWFRQAIRENLHPTDECAAFLLWIANSRAHYKFGIASDGTTDEQLEVLVRLGVIPLIDPNLILISESIGYEKSSSAIYQAAIDVAKVEPSEIAMVGDNLERDVATPSSLGLRTVLLDRSRVAQPKEAANAICADLYEVANLFDASRTTHS